MIELPEALTLANQISEFLAGKTVVSTTAAQSPHKFAWYHGDPANYPTKLNGSRILSARAQACLWRSRSQTACCFSATASTCACTLQPAPPQPNTSFCWAWTTAPSSARRWQCMAALSVGQSPSHSRTAITRPPKPSPPRSQKLSAKPIFARCSPPSRCASCR